MSWIWMMWIYSYGKMGNQTVQLVVRHCCKMSSKATFLVLLNTFKPNQVVASCVNTDFGLDKITGESRRHAEKQNCWASKTRNMYRFCCKKKSNSLLSFFPQPATTWFVARQFDSWVVNAQRGWLFNSFWSNVAKGDARFCCSFCCILIPGRVL